MAITDVVQNTSSEEDGLLLNKAPQVKTWEAGFPNLINLGFCSQVASGNDTNEDSKW